MDLCFALYTLCFSILVLIVHGLVVCSFGLLCTCVACLWSSISISVTAVLGNLDSIIVFVVCKVVTACFFTYDFLVIVVLFLELLHIIGRHGLWSWD